MLTRPTPALVDAAIEQFKKENEVDEVALTDLFDRYRGNSVRPHVLLKVAAVNSIYSTHVYAFKELAKYIAERGDELDHYLQSGDLQAFSLIERFTTDAERKSHPFSFASKYCSWEMPHAFPIYDSCVEAYLWQVLKQDEFGMKRSELWNYQGFCGAVDRLRQRYDLQSYSYKQLDAFLYLQGLALLNKQ